MRNSPLPATVGLRRLTTKFPALAPVGLPLQRLQRRPGHLRQRSAEWRKRNSADRHLPSASRIFRPLNPWVELNCPGFFFRLRRLPNWFSAGRAASLGVHVPPAPRARLCFDAGRLPAPRFPNRHVCQLRWAAVRYLITLSVRNFPHLPFSRKSEDNRSRLCACLEKK